MTASKDTVPKMIKRRPSGDHDENLDSNSILTDNSKSTKQSDTSKKDTKKKKKGSSSKKTKTDSDKKSRSKESTRNKPDAKKKVKQTRQYDEDISSPLEPKKKKKNDLSKLSRKDRLYHSNSNDRTLESMATSIESPYHSSNNTQDDSDSSDNNLLLSRYNSDDSDSVSLSDSSDEEGTPSRMRRNRLASGNRGPPPRRGINRNMSAPVKGAKRTSRSPIRQPPMRSQSSHSEANKRPGLGVKRTSKSPMRQPPMRSQSAHVEAKKGPSVNRTSKSPIRPPMRSQSAHVEANKGPGFRRNNSMSLDGAGQLSTHRPQRKNPPPVRFSSRDNSGRSASADDVMVEMQRTLVRASNHKTLNNARGRSNANKNTSAHVPASRDAPLRRGVTRNASLPIRSTRKSSRSPAPRRGQPQRQPPSRTNSKEMSAAQHVDLLRDVTVGKLPTTNSGLSATLDAKDDDGVSLDSGIDHEDLNDSKCIIEFDPKDRDMSRTRSLSRTRSPRLGLNRSTSGTSMSWESEIDEKRMFDNDPKWKQALRYIRLLAPHKDETILKKKIRIFTWMTIILDFIAALVAVLQYDKALECCGEPAFNTFLNMNWDTLFRVVTILYICMIFAEVVPVIKNGIPFNIVNPTIAMFIMFGMFFDDSIIEAVIMWIIEALAIFSEFMVYRVNATLYHETSDRLKEVDAELKALMKRRKELKENIKAGSLHSGSCDASRHSDGSFHSGDSFYESRHGGHRVRSNSKDSSIDDLEMGKNAHNDEDDDSLSGHSFGGDEDFYDEKTPSGRSVRPNSVKRSTPPLLRTKSKASQHPNDGLRHGSRHSRHHSRDASRNIPRRTNSREPLGRTPTMHSLGSQGSYDEDYGITGVVGGRIRLRGEVKKNRLLRQRRLLRKDKESERKDLRYHLIGTILNVSLAALAMILIITIYSTVSILLCSFDHL